jgi:RNA recognition motif-containing protein
MTPKPKLSFWQRIVAFFKGSPPPAPEIREKPAPSATAREKISRKPELVEVTSPKLYVGNLSFDATESDLFELFNGVGQVRNAEVVCHKYTQRSKGFAFVQMTTIEEARRAVQELHDKEFLGRKLVVSGAKTPDMERAA